MNLRHLLVRFTSFNSFPSISSFPSIFSIVLGSNEYKLAQIILGPCIMVMAVEVIVDWIKHAFIVKFNGLLPAVYTEFMHTLCRDLLGVANRREQECELKSPVSPNNASELDKNFLESPLVTSPIESSSIPVPQATSSADDRFEGNTLHDRSPIVSKRLGFVSIPLACLVIRVGYQILQIVGVMPEPTTGEPLGHLKSNAANIPVDDESIGSWKLPYKLSMWIKTQRNSFEKAGISYSYWIPSRYFPAFIVIFFRYLDLFINTEYSFVVFKLMLGLLLIKLSKWYMESIKKEQENEKKLDEILKEQTPHHMLSRKLIPRQNSSMQKSASLDSVDRFSMVKSRIP
jgi:Eukaryotic membrane protein family